MNGSQPALDLWSVEMHQVGWIKLPWPTAAGSQAGELIPAWQCCRCGGVELNRIFWEWSHGCCGPNPRFQACAGRGHPYDMTPYWIPPAEKGAA